nr:MULTISPECIES: DUF481 domain-containing protein [unclassified Psychrosphaera]
MSAELGVLLTSGNTNSTSFLSKITASHEILKWRFKYDLNALLKQDEKFDSEKNREVLTTTAEKYSFDAQGNYELTRTNGVFALISHTDDRFASFTKYSMIVAGYAFRGINKSNMFLDLNLGPGYARGVLKADGAVEEGPVVRASAAYSWVISKSAKFVQNVSVQTAGFNNRSISETSIVTKISDSMQMKVGFRAIHNSEVATNLKNLDTQTSVTLVVNI